MEHFKLDTNSNGVLNDGEKVLLNQVIVAAPFSVNEDMHRMRIGWHIGFTTYINPSLNGPGMVLDGTQVVRDRGAPKGSNGNLNELQVHPKSTIL